MDASSVAVDFRLIDPPVSPKPVYPNRLLLLPLTLMLALGAVLSVRGKSDTAGFFFDARACAKTTGLPLLGVVSKKVSDADIAKDRRRLRQFIAGVLALVVAYGAGMVLLVYLSARTA